MGGKKEAKRVASPESVPTHRKITMDSEYFIFMDSEYLYGLRIINIQLIPIISNTDISKYILIYQGPVVQSIVSLTRSLRGQLVKCFTTL